MKKVTITWSYNSENISIEWWQSNSSVLLIKTHHANWNAQSRNGDTLGIIEAQCFWFCDFLTVLCDNAQSLVLSNILVVSIVFVINKEHIMTHNLLWYMIGHISTLVVTEMLSAMLACSNLKIFKRLSLLQKELSESLQAQGTIATGQTDSEITRYSYNSCLKLIL